MPDELSNPAKCEACGTPLPFEVEPGREWLCPRCFSALTPAERKSGVVKAAPPATPPALPPSERPTPRSTPAAKKRKDSKR